MTDEEYMRLALGEAAMAAREGEVPIGAILVQNDKVIARAHNRVEQDKQGSAHAELLVIQEASRLLDSWRLDGCTLYVTKEPCPMCAGAMVNCRVSRVVFGCPDPKYGAAGGKINVCTLPEALQKIEITAGILQEACAEILRQFFQKRRTESAKRRENINE